MRADRAVPPQVAADWLVHGDDITRCVVKARSIEFKFEMPDFPARSAAREIHLVQQNGGKRGMARVSLFRSGGGKRCCRRGITNGEGFQDLLHPACNSLFIIHIAIDSGDQAMRTSGSEGRIEIPSGLAKPRVARVAQCQYREAEVAQIRRLAVR